MVFIMNREKYEKAVRKFLAPYACHKSRGRKITETEGPYRVPFQRDRDRILFSPSFRRLEFKTQVYVYRESDYYRTRLTHTLEVMQTSTELARFLRLNVDLVEAIALGHDLGHAPFGHAGEEALNSCVRNGGFHHNEQGLRIVDKLETFGRFKDGLNLTWEVREGILKHTMVQNNHIYKEEFFENTNPNGTLEAQLVNISDEIVQVVHDIDDSLRAKIVPFKEIEEVWDKITFPEPYKSELGRYKYNNYSSWLLGPLMNDIVVGTFETIKGLTFEDVLDSTEFLVVFDKLAPTFEELRKILRKIHSSVTISRMDFKGKKIIKELFRAFRKNIFLLPEDVRDKIDGENKERIICDYIASMTDRTAHEMYDKMFLPYRE